MSNIVTMYSKLIEYCNMKVEKLTILHNESTQNILKDLNIPKKKVGPKNINSLMNYNLDYDNNPPAIINIYIIKAYVKEINKLSPEEFKNLKDLQKQLLGILENTNLCSNIAGLYPDKNINQICSKEKNEISSFINNDLGNENGL